MTSKKVLDVFKYFEALNGWHTLNHKIRFEDYGKCLSKKFEVLHIEMDIEKLFWKYNSVGWKTEKVCIY